MGRVEYDISHMVGKEFSSVIGMEAGSTEVAFMNDDWSFRFYHDMECCEGVCVEDVCGDADDLLGTPILVAEEVSNYTGPVVDGRYEGEYQWTFYRFVTVKGTVTVRWLGESNGFYSTDVDLHVFKKDSNDGR